MTTTYWTDLCLYKSLKKVCNSSWQDKTSSGFFSAQQKVKEVPAYPQRTITMPKINKPRMRT